MGASQSPGEKVLISYVCPATASVVEVTRTFVLARRRPVGIRDFANPPESRSEAIDLFEGIEILVLVDRPTAGQTAVSIAGTVGACRLKGRLSDSELLEDLREQHANGAGGRPSFALSTGPCRLLPDSPEPLCHPHQPVPPVTGAIGGHRSSFAFSSLLAGQFSGV
jgi:hypothetical protein